MIFKFIKSVRHAFNGIVHTISNEPNFRIQLGIAFLTLLGGFYFDISRVEWIFVTMAIGFVLVAELFNTAIENLCDHITSEIHPKIGLVKDISAASVVIAAMTALVIGFLIFGPYLLKVISS